MESFLKGMDDGLEGFARWVTGKLNMTVSLSIYVGSIDDSRR